MRLAKTDLLPILKDLAVAMPGAKDRDPAAMLDGYYDALDDCTLTEVQQGARQCKRELKYFPAAASLRRQALDYRKNHPAASGEGPLAGRHRAWMADGMIGPCPVCGAEMEWPNGQRGGVVHNEQIHREARISYAFPSWALPSRLREP